MIKKILSFNDWKKLAFIVGVKLLLFIFFSIHFSNHWVPELMDGAFFIRSGDTEFYLSPIENLVDGKGYTKFINDKAGDGNLVPFAGRMPGFVPVYAPLYYFFGKIPARNALIFIQVLLSILSVYTLSQIAKLIFRSEIMAWITVVLYSISSFVSILDHLGFAESLAVSSLIFSTWFLLKACSNSNSKLFFLSGLFLTWSIFLRPALGINMALFPLIALILFLQGLSISRSQILFRISLLCAPFIFFESLWIAKNYSTFKIFVPFELYSNNYGDKYSPQVIELQNLVIAWGGNIQQWGPETEMKWFYEEDITSRVNVFKENYYTSAYNLDSLMLLRELFQSSLSKKLNSYERNVLASESIALSKRFKKSYKLEKPIQYFVFAKLRLLNDFLFVTSLNYFPFPKLADMSLIQKMVKGFYFLLYYFAILFGLVGMVLALIKIKTYTTAILLMLIPLSQIFVHAVWFGFIEHRYFIPSYPFFVLFAAFAVYSIVVRKVERHQDFLSSSSRS